MSNRLCDALGIEYPVICGAMAWTSMAPLVAAVSKAGGLGVLGSGFMPKEIILAQMAAVREMTDKPFAANLFLDPGPMLDNGVQAILEGKPAVAYIDSLNLLEYEFTKKYYDIFHENGIKVVAKINYLEDALVAAKAGADAIITKGFEGGGHVTKVSARVLLAEVTQAIKDIPIVASGGIATPRQAAGCSVQGADGIEMGTAFMATSECPIHLNSKQAIVEATDRDIVACGMSTGEPSWQIKNALAEEMLKIDAQLPWSEAADKIREMSAGSLRIAALEGDREKGAVLAGQVCGLIHDIVPCEERIVKFCEEWAALLKQQYSLF